MTEPWHSPAALHLDTARCEHPAALVLPDFRLHRRAKVHYLWLPGETNPTLHRDLYALIDCARNAGLQHIHVLRSLADHHYHCLSLAPPD